MLRPPFICNSDLSELLDSETSLLIDHRSKSRAINIPGSIGRGGKEQFKPTEHDTRESRFKINRKYQIVIFSHLPITLSLQSEKQ